MKIFIHALVGVAYIALVSVAPAQVPPAQAPAHEGAGQSIDPAPYLPFKLTPDDLQLLRTFDAGHQKTIDNAMAASDNDPAFLADARQILSDTAPRPVDGEAALIGRWRCRSVQFSDASVAGTSLTGVFTYPYFQCAIAKKDGKLFFAKTSGSQRESGFLYRVDNMRYVFAGGSSVNNDPQKAYGESPSSNVVGWLTAAGGKRFLLQMPSNDFGNLEILELVK